VRERENLKHLQVRGLVSALACFSSGGWGAAYKVIAPICSIVSCGGGQAREREREKERERVGGREGDRD
jgi:hypothetical protein